LWVISAHHLAVWSELEPAGKMGIARWCAETSAFSQYVADSVVAAGTEDIKGALHGDGLLQRVAFHGVGQWAGKAAFPRESTIAVVDDDSRLGVRFSDLWNQEGDRSLEI
jgi:hypothetical protein